MLDIMSDTGDHETNKPDVALPTQNLHSSRGERSGRINYPGMI